MGNPSTWPSFGGVLLALVVLEPPLVTFMEWNPESNSGALLDFGIELGSCRWNLGGVGKGGQGMVILSKVVTTDFDITGWQNRGCLGSKSNVIPLLLIFNSQAVYLLKLSLVGGCIVPWLLAASVTTIGKLFASLYTRLCVSVKLRNKPQHELELVVHNTLPLLWTCTDLLGSVVIR